MKVQAQITVFASILLFWLGESKKQQQVTCGSVIKLLNTYYDVRLHSHDIRYGSGSGQQSVTGLDTETDVNSLWAIRGKNENNPCKRGEVIKCGQEIRLTHQETGKNLHSHHFSSPLTNNQEVSAFGDGGKGDTGDAWKVICTGDAWARNDHVGFKHIDTGVFLGSTGRTFGRPIHGHVEIVGFDSPGSTTQWKTAEGIFVHQDDFDPTGGRTHDHDEL